MRAAGIKAAVIAGVLVTTGFFVAPASGANADRTATIRAARRAAAPLRTALVFTPAAADPRLAAVFARGGLDSSGFRFTPADTGRDHRAVTVAVRARTARPDTTRVAAADPTALAPIAYNLGVAVGWRRFGIAGDVRRVDMGVQPGGREAADVTVTYAGDRVAGRVKAVADRPFAAVTPRVDSERSYSLDLGGSYRLTRNLDLTAGLRYRTERDQLVRLDDNRRDSRAVYVGTAFRF